jgi:hypothetical protein
MLVSKIFSLRLRSSSSPVITWRTPAILLSQHGACLEKKANLLSPMGWEIAIEPPLQAEISRVRPQSPLHSLRVNLLDWNAQLVDAVRELRCEGFVDLGIR